MFLYNIKLTENIPIQICGKLILNGHKGLNRKFSAHIVNCLSYKGLKFAFFCLIGNVNVTYISADYFFEYGPKTALW